MPKLKRILLFSLLPISFFSLLLLPIHHHHSLHTSPLRNPFPPPPKLAYFISGTENDTPRIFRLLQVIYHPRNYYLLHLDQRASAKQRHELAEMVKSVELFVVSENVKVFEKADAVHDEGSSGLGLMLHGAAVLLRWKRDWDWFVNLDGSDYPLISQDDFLHILSFVPREVNFIEHTSNISLKEYQRIMEIVVDPRLYLASKGRMFMGTKRRKLPNAFRFFTGSSHVLLSRKLVEFSILGWDNLPRTLLMYFSNTRFSHRGYFQTLACNSKDFSNTVINSNLRLIEWYPKSSDLKDTLRSGAAFARKFPANDPVLDMIDSQVLHRSRGMIAPGGWCLGTPGWGRDPCVHWGETDILKPGPGSKIFEKLLLRLMVNMTIKSNICHGQRSGLAAG